MKKRFFSLFVCTALLLSIVFSAHTAWAEPSSNGDGTIYTDPETGVTFVVPENWEERELDSDSSKSFRARFHSLDDSRDLFLYGYLDVWNEMPAPERSGHTRSDVDSSYFYSKETLRELFVTLLAQSDFSVAADDVQFVRCGKNEYVEITFVREVGSRTVTFISSMYIENGYGYFFTFGAASDAAIEDYRSVLSSMQVPLPDQSSPGDRESHRNSGSIYTDVDMEMCFELPAGWAKKESDAETEDPFVTFVFLKDPRNTFQYSSYDLWGQMPFWGRFFLPRSEVNSASVYERESMMEAIVNRFSQDGLNVELNDIQLVTYGENEFIEVPITMQADGIIFLTTQFIHIKNGRVYLFTFGRQNDEAAADFESVLASLQVSPAGGSVFSSPAPSSLNIGMIALEFFLTFFIYALPLLIYRHFIRKSPLSRKRALIVLTVYEAAAYVLTRIVWFWLTQYKASYLILIFWSLLTYLNIIPRRNSRSTSKKTGRGAAFPQAAGTAVPQAQSAAQHGASAAAAPTAPDASMWPAQYHSAQDMRVGFPKQAEKASESIPVPPAVQTLPAAPAATYIPAAPIPAPLAPQTPPSPAEHTTVSPAPQTPPSAPRIQFCKNCGFRLLDDSKFCSCCGTPVVPAAKE